MQSKHNKGGLFDGNKARGQKFGGSVCWILGYIFVRDLSHAGDTHRFCT
jgi:hypothetical protein